MKGESARWIRILSLVFALAILAVAPLCFAQQLTATLSGDVFDASEGLVPNATVTLRNQASGDLRTVVSNGSGHFTLTALPPGTYDVTVTATGFKKWTTKGVVLNQGDSRVLNGIKLAVGTASQTVEVSGDAVTVPQNNAEISTTLSTRLIEDTPLVGRDAGELLKVIPGMAATNGLNQGSSFNDQVVGSNNGPVGSFSSNGTQPNGAMAFMLDGANLVDPGNMGTQIANINQDMVSQIKVLTNDYDAEYAKGPTIFEAFSKSGGSNYHGEAYWYVRDSALNSVDAYLKSTGGSNLPERYQYVGGNIGGPVLLPFTSFNRDRKKMFFWGGYEYMHQVVPGTTGTGESFPVFMNVPSAAQLNGDFSETGVPQGAVNQWGYAYGGMYNPPPSSCGGSSTTVPQACWDPNILGIAKLFAPKGVLGNTANGPWAANVTPTASNNWNNFEYEGFVPQNRWEATGKVDYDFTDNTKLSVSFTRQDETDQHPIGVWWVPPWTLPYPGGVQAPTTSTVIMSNFTHAFNPTTTNEFVFTFARYINPNQLGSSSAASRKNLGFNVSGLFGHTSTQIPDIGGVWGGNFPYITNFSFDNGFGGGSQFGGLKRDPALYDNFTKVIGPHTIKAGMYWDTSENIQSATGLQNGDNGSYNFGWGPGDTGNVVADFLTGSGFANYQQQSSAYVNDLKFHQWAVYAQDSFQANHQLTLNFGLRLDHVGQWYGPANGLQVWDPAVYNQNPTAPNAGLLWHKNNSNIPLSGLESRLFYPEPRASLAYDVFGNQKSVVRAGFAMFRYQISTEVCNACGGPQGSFVYQTPGFSGGYGGMTAFTPPSGVLQNGSTVYAIQKGDDQTPLVSDWNVTWSQAMPWRSVLSVSYIGNKSQHLWIDGTNGNLNNLNNRPMGAFFQADPRSGQFLSAAPPPCSSSNPDGQSLYCQNAPSDINYGSTISGSTVFDYAPLSTYQNLYMISNAGYSNYNSLQMEWQKQAGALYFDTNYTFSKVLGIWDWTSNNGAAGGNTVDPYNIRNNYGPMAYDHTHILNFVYSYNTPSPIHNNFVLGGVVNGWTLAGYTTYQSGAPIQPNTELNVTWPGGLTVPTVGIPNLPDNSIKLPLRDASGVQLVATGMNPSTWFGTDSPHYLLPTLTCDPRKNLPSGYYFNPNCFSAPGPGQQGALEWPYIKGPAFFDSDLSIFKKFKIKEGKTLEFRLQANNWLNHPLPEFGLAGTGDEQLNFQKTTPAVYTDTAGKQVNENIISLSPTNTNPLTTGKPLYKTGSRLITAALKFYF